MGLRGAQAGRRREAREELEAMPRKRALPWLRKGLTRPQRVERFLQYLPITKGPLQGTRMKLLPEQRRFVYEIYGNLDEHGLRRWRMGVKSEPKGNGKTGLVAGLCLCHLLGPESERRGEVYSAAIDRQQAGIIFAEMDAIIAQVPEFGARVNVQRFHKRIEDLETGSIYEALSADARRAHGLAPSLFAYDELAQARDGVLLENLMNGLGKRREALGLVISTQAPDDDHPLSKLIDNPNAFTYIELLSAPEDADPFDEATWRACNPALGKYLSLKEMREAAERARQIPAFESSFRNLRLNQRVDAREEDRLVSAAVWKTGAVPIDRERLRGRACYAGLDLSGKHDLTALVLAFPDDDPEPSFDLLPFFWTPEGQLAGRKPVEQQRFREWIAQGHMTAVPGPTVRFSFVAQQLVELSREFDIQVLGYDRWRIDDLKQDLTEIDANFPAPLEPFGQGFKDMGPAIEWFAELALTGRLRHAGHPVLTSSVASAIVVSDPAGNHKVDKPRGNKQGIVRVDGAVAMLIALELAKRAPAPIDIGSFLSDAVMLA